MALSIINNGDLGSVVRAALNAMFGELYRAITQQTLIDQATITWDLNSGQDAIVTLGGIRVLANPTNAVNGMVAILEIRQDATGSRTITSWGSEITWSGDTAPTLTTTPNRKDIITLRRSNNKWVGTFSGNYPI